jgi:hypothetical protein
MIEHALVSSNGISIFIMRIATFSNAKSALRAPGNPGRKALGWTAVLSFTAYNAG